MTAPRTRRDAQATRQRLLAAALDLFTSVGYRATTTPLIAERAGTTEATIYRHFTGKEELLNEVYRGAQEWALALVKSPDAARIPHPMDRLDWVARRFLDTAVTHPGLMRMLLQQREDRVLDDRSQVAGREFRESLVQLVAMGKSDGLVRAGPAELWTGAWLAVVGWGVERVCAREWTPEHPHVGLLLEAARRAIGI